MKVMHVNNRPYVLFDYKKSRGRNKPRWKPRISLFSANSYVCLFLAKILYHDRNKQRKN